MAFLKCRPKKNHNLNFIMTRLRICVYLRNKKTLIL